MAALALSSCGLRASFLPPELFSMILPPLLNGFQSRSLHVSDADRQLLPAVPALSEGRYLKVVHFRRPRVVRRGGRAFEPQFPSLLWPFSSRSGCKDQ